MAPTKLAYWKGRGIVTPIKMVLAYANVEYEYKAYVNEACDRYNNEWFTEDKPKFADTFDFPNLPYYIDDEVKLTQSKVIMQYLGRKYGLYATNDTDALRMNLIIEQANDMFDLIDNAAHIKPSVSNKQEVHEALKNEYLESIPTRLAQVAKFLGDNDWVIKGQLTIADFWLYDCLDFHRLLFNPKHFNAFPTLVAYAQRFEEVKGVKEFLATWNRMPTHAPYAFFGQTKDYKPTD